MDTTEQRVEMIVSEAAEREREWDGRRQEALGRLEDMLKVIEQVGCLTSDADEAEVQEGIYALTRVLQEYRDERLMNAVREMLGR